MRPSPPSGQEGHQNRDFSPATHFKTMPSSLNCTSQSTPVPLSFDHRDGNTKSFHCFKATAATSTDTPAPQPAPERNRNWSEPQTTAGGGLVQPREQTGICSISFPRTGWNKPRLKTCQGVGTSTCRMGYDRRAKERFAMRG